MRASHLLHGTPSAQRWRRSIPQQQKAAPTLYRHCHGRWTSSRVQEVLPDSLPAISTTSVSASSSSGSIEDSSLDSVSSDATASSTSTSSSPARPEHAVGDVQLDAAEKRLLAAGMPLADVLARRKRKQQAKEAPRPRTKRQSPKQGRRPAAVQSVQDDAAGAHAGAVAAAGLDAAAAADSELWLSPTDKRLLAAGYPLEVVLARQMKRHKRGVNLVIPKTPGKIGRPRKQVDGRSLPEILQRSEERLAKYVGWGAPPPGAMTEFALNAAAAAAAEGPAPVYAWPKEVPTVLPSKLHIGFATENDRDAILQDIERGADDMANTHTPLQTLLDCMAAGNSAQAASSDASSSSSAAGLTSSSSSQGVDSGDSSGGSSDGSSADSDCRSAVVLAAIAAGHQVYDLHWLQQRAAADPGAPAIVPDSERPFTLTMQNPADGKDYVVAHYEPRVLNFDKAKSAALLAQVYYNGNKMSRNSAPREEKMVMAGMRVPRRTEGSTHFGRYSGDTGPEPDQFSMACSPDLLRTGGFRAIAGQWMERLPGMVCAMNQEAARTANPMRNPRANRGPPMNFPACTLLGGPFTSLAVTQNYRSNLHAEPKEHPFSYIAWLDVLSAGSTIEVGYFWLTNGLAFIPQDASALYIDVRLVPHCSDPSYVHNGDPTARVEYEGRYGAALFIKPDVMQENIQQWVAFDKFQEMAARGEIPETPETDDASS